MANSEGLFRKSALQKLSSPEQLDQTITIIKLQGWIGLCALGALLFGVFLWSIVGSIPEKVNGNGVLINSNGLLSVTYASGGVVKGVFLENGEKVFKGQVIARIERQDLMEQLQVASQKLANLQKRYESDSQLYLKSAGMTDKMLAKNEIDLDSQIKTLDTQIADAQKKVQTMKELFDEGLITNTAYLETRNALFSLQRQKQETERQLLNTGVDRIKSAGSSNQQLLSLQQQIDEARMQLNIQQENYENATRVISPESGTVYEVSIAKGSYISPGATIAVIEPFSSNGSTLEATMFFAGKDGKRVKPGMTIDVSPSTVKQEEYGYIQGIVTSVSKFPATPQYIQATFQNQSLTQTFSQLEAPIEIKVRLIPDSKTVTGYKWSSSKGPDETLETGILCYGAVTVKEQRPIALVIPLIKKNVFGIGESAL
jgi:HlyD family secretion protein